MVVRATRLLLAGVAFLSLAWPSQPHVLAGVVQSSQGGPITKPYILVLQTRQTQEEGPDQTKVYLVESDDGMNWSLIPNWVPFYAMCPT